jgi:hypothetical protein
MNAPAKLTRPDLLALLSLFPSADDIAGHQTVAPEAVPQPYRDLLVHPHHMTVTVEAHHGDEVRTRILNVHRDGDSYARRILLELKGSGRVVQYGIVRVNLALCAPAVRDEIVAGQKPFGRILIDHDVMRRIEPTEFLQIVPGPNMVGWFGLARPEPTYGRLALIHCDERPAVELVEIVIPES